MAKKNVLRTREYISDGGRGPQGMRLEEFDDGTFMATIWIDAETSISLPLSRAEARKFGSFALKR